MTAALVHRGPDEGGIWQAPGIGLGHRRLRVIAPLSASQPMLDSAGSTCLVLNGTIYNHADLAEELGKRGRRIVSGSDTEAVIHALVEWGSEALVRLDGMFALAWWDRASRRLLLARDRFGQKPLYYVRIPGGWLFASELRALLCHPEFESRLDPDALRRYLLFEYVPAPRCLLRDVRKVEPGTFVELDGQSLEETVRRYWTLPSSPAATWGRKGAGLDEASEELIHRLRRAANKQLVADVPCGLLLSGGLDSGTLAAVLTQRSLRPAAAPGRPEAGSRRKGHPLQTFNLALDDPSYDESWAAARVASHLGTEHRSRLLPESGLVDLSIRFMEIVDEPLGDPSLLPTYALAAFSREHVRVVLAGDGGDELLAGYPTFQAEWLGAALSRLAPPRILAGARRVTSWLPTSHANISWDFKLKQFLRGVGLPPVARHQVWLGSLTPAESGELLVDDVAGAAQDADPLLELEARVSSGETPSTLSRLRNFYLDYYLSGDLLPKSDLAGMAVGLEVRAPFLDPDVVSFACSLPDAYRYRLGTTKVVLRHAARRLLPREIVSRPKKGFGIPIGRWLKGPLKPLMEELLSVRALSSGGIFRTGAVRRLVEEHLRGRANHRKPLWTLMMFQLSAQRLGVG